MPNSGSLPKSTISISTDRLLATVAVGIVVIGAVLWCARGVHAEKTDFSVTYVGAYIVHQGWGAQLYDLGLQTRVRDSLFTNPNPLYYEHPPFEALLFAPMALLPFRTAYLLWGFLNATVWIFLMLSLRNYLPWPRDDFAYSMLWLLFAPLGVALFQGQSSLLIFAAYAVAFMQFKRSREFRAGAALGFALLKLQFALPFALIMLLRKKWGFVEGFACSSLILSALSLLAVGRWGAASYVRLLLQIGNNPQNLSYGSAVDMPTINGFVYAIAGRILSHQSLSAVVAALSILLLYFVALQWKAANVGRGDDLMFASAIAACLLASSHMFTQDFSPLLLGMLLLGADLADSRNAERPNRALRIASIASLAVFWAFPVYFICVAWHCLYLMCLVLLVFAFATMQMALVAERQASDEYARAK